MRLMLRIFTAFCVATVLAQGIILAMAAAKGNLKSDFILKGAALLNGIDISGERLQRMLDDYRQAPVPTHDEVLEQRAKEGLILQQREESIRRMSDDLEKDKIELNKKTEDLDNRVAEFYQMLDREKSNILDESLLVVKTTLESVAPEQAKAQLLLLWEDDKKPEVLAMLSAMPVDKRKKIVGEFIGPEEEKKFKEILTMLLDGGETVALIDKEKAKVEQPK